jgi:Putative metallopeptidase
MSRPWLPCALLLIALGAEPLPAQSLDPAGSLTQAFQAGVNEAARMAAEVPYLKNLPARQRQAHVEFVFGNVLFVAAHELGHALVSEMKLPILGREEDAADVFAILTALWMGDQLSHRVLEDAAKGWFLAARRDRREGRALDYYERHGLNEQRAYQIVCLMVGSDPVRFKALADETKLPPDRRRTCAWDYETVVSSWENVLAPHRRADDQPRTRIDVTYEEGKGVLAISERIFRATRFLETVAEHIGERYAWPSRIEFEMRTCGHANARWTIAQRKLHICYELVREFVELSLAFGPDRLRPAAAGSARRRSRDEAHETPPNPTRTYRPLGETHNRPSRRITR